MIRNNVRYIFKSGTSLFYIFDMLSEKKLAPLNDSMRLNNDQMNKNQWSNEMI